MKIRLHVVGFLNVYVARTGHVQTGGVYRTREAADTVAKPHRVCCLKVRFPNNLNSKLRA